MINVHFIEFASHIELPWRLLNRIWMQNDSDTAFGCHAACTGLSGSMQTGTGPCVLHQANQRGVVKFPAYLESLFRPTHTPNVAFPIQ